MFRRKEFRSQQITFRVVQLLALSFTLPLAPCAAQSGAAPNYGFHSYSVGSHQYGTGISGYPRNNSFNTGLNGFAQHASPQYSTQRSTQAAENLARQVNDIAARSPLGNVLGNAERMMQHQQPAYSQTASTTGLVPPVSKRDLMRTFMEGGLPMNSGNGPLPSSGSTSGAAGTAYNNYQTAENEARKARNSAQRTRNSNTSSYNRKSDASYAEYAANNANYAAQRAESAAYNGDSQARGYANLARQAANRAREDANRARYNADTMN